MGYCNHGMMNQYYIEKEKELAKKSKVKKVDENTSINKIQSNSKNNISPQ